MNLPSNGGQLSAHAVPTPETSEASALCPPCPCTRTEHWFPQPLTTLPPGLPPPPSSALPGGGRCSGGGSGHKGCRVYSSFRAEAGTPMAWGGLPPASIPSGAEGQGQGQTWTCSCVPPGQHAAMRPPAVPPAAGLSPEACFPSSAGRGGGGCTADFPRHPSSHASDGHWLDRCCS